MASKKIVLAGGTGNIGNLLRKVFVELDYEVIILSRKFQHAKRQNISYVQWDGETKGDWIQALDAADALINLSGKSIQCRFTESNKKELLDSRLQPTKILAEAIEEINTPPRLWINFSGVSIFEGIDGKHDETSKNYGNTFLANLTKQWESAFFSAKTLNTTKVCLRLSPVLSRDFGMFKELYPLAKLGLGGQVGNGKQQVCWIHEQDLVKMVLWIINHESPSTLYHACTPEPASNKEFMKNLRKAVGMPLGIPLPTVFAQLGAFFKGVESDMLLLTNEVYANQPTQEGFKYIYPTTFIAFEQLTKK